MKKILSLFVVLFSIIFLASCQFGNSNQPNPDEGNNEPEKYTITYNLDGGVLPSDAISSFLDGSKVVLPIPTKEDHLFKGWFDEEDNLVNDLKGTMSDVTLYAKWEEFIKGVTYNIEYILYDGFFVEEVNYTYKSGEEYLLPIPVKPGYNFISWCEYESNEEVTKIEATSSGDVKFYAWFEKATIEREITYHVDGGVLPETTKYTYIEGTGQGLPKPTKEGYYFRGWYTTSSFEKIVTAITVTSYGNREFYAKWVEASIENANFGFLGDSISTFYSPTSSFNSLFSGENQFYYPRYSQTVSSVTQTWWYKTVQQIGGNLFVNNSYSGGTVYGTGMSAGNTAQRIAKFNQKGQSPDVIIIYLGINDAVGKLNKDTFKKAYLEMIDKILTQFSGVQLFICSLPYETYTDGVSRAEFNIVISEISVERNIPLIDFANAWTDSTEKKNDWYYLGDNIHPSAKGMDRLAQIAVAKIKEFYNLD